MDAVPQLANIAPVAGAAAADAAGPAAGQAAGAAFQLPAAGADPAVAENSAGARNPRRMQRGETLPDGGNLLPLVVGLLPPVTSLAAAAAPTDAVATGGAPTPVAPPALASLAQAARPPLERGAKAAPPPRPAASAFDHLLASNLPAEARAAIAAALEAAASTAGRGDTAATPAPQAAPAPQTANLPSAGAAPAAASVATLDLLTTPAADAAGDLLPVPVPQSPPSSSPPLRIDASVAVASATSGAAPAERRDAPPSAAATNALEHAAAAVVIDPSPPLDDGAEGAPAAAPPPAFTHLLPGAPRGAESSTVMNLATPVGSPGWSESLGERVAWLVQQDLGQAHLKLNPPQLGPVEVRVQINGDQAAVSFTAHNQQTRDALTDASQRLRDLLGAQGFVNVQVDVGQQPFQERPTLVAPYDDDAGPAAVGSTLHAPAATSAPRGARVLFDAYA